MDILILFSDGVTETAATSEKDSTDEPVQFGRERLVDTGLANLEKTAEEIAQAIISAGRKFGGGKSFEDDVTVMVIKRLAAESYPPTEDLTPLSPDVRR